MSLNAAIDHIIDLPVLNIGQVQRATQTISQAGGKAINVARVLSTLGYPVCVVGFAGGCTGEEIQADLAQNQIPAHFIPIAGNSRNCYILVDRSNRRQTVINEVGPTISAKDYQLLHREVLARLPDAELLICSGSIPPGIDLGCYGDFVQLAHMQGIKTLIDTSGTALRVALAAKPYFIKPNREEAEQLFNVTVTDDNAMDMAREIHRQGASIGLVSLGGSGAVAAWQTGEAFIAAPRLSIVNTVACGDAFLAGCAAALLANEPIISMVRWGIAAGCANALVGGARIDYETVLKLYQDIAMA